MTPFEPAAGRPQAPPRLQAEKYELLRRAFGFDGFRPGQEQVVDCLAAGRDALAVMPTGAGKSLCFQLPALMRGGLTVVVSPLLALMQNQVAALRMAGIAAGSVNSSQSREENVAAWRDAARGRAKLLYLSPERLMNARMLAALAKLPLAMVAIDEAHCISQWGPSFRPEYEALTELRARFPHATLAAFTASADPSTRDDIAQRLFGGKVASFVTGFDRPNIALAVATKADGFRQLAAFVEARRGQCGIVYALSRRRSEEAAAMLAARNHKALAYHAGMEADERKALLDRFLTEPGIVMVATIAFGMGIDKPDVRYVAHIDLPATMEAYYQELGRAGRDGQPADAAMFYGLGDILMRRRFIDESQASDERKHIDRRRLDALVGYCEASTCRRRILLAYFGERAEEDCGRCDNCLTPPQVVDGSDLARRVLEAVLATGQRFGTGHIVDVLTGSESERIVRRHHQQLPVHGSGRDLKPAAWRSAIRQLVAAGVLDLDIGGYGALRATGRGRRLLGGEGEVRLRLETLRTGRRARGHPTGQQPAAGRPSTPDEMALLQALKELRLALARKNGVPAYVVFHDTTLAALAADRPATREAFARIHGIGAAKTERFAEAFLACIARFRGGGS